jgi:hypothetical protein
MFESRRSQQQSHSSKVFAFRKGLAPVHVYATAPSRKILLWLVALAFLAGASRTSAAPGATTATTLTVSSGSVTAGTVTTLTATVTRTGFPGPTTTNVTLGQVVFCDATAAQCDGAAVFGTARMTPGGTAQLKLILGVGTHSIKAVYQGFVTSNRTPPSISAAQTVTVTANSSYLTFTQIAETGSQGNYTLTGTVTAFGRAPATGTVSFIDTSDGNAVVGTAALNPASLATVFNPAAGSPLGTDDGVAFVATGDFNNDGIPDLAWVSARGGSVQVSLGNGDGTFTIQSSIELANPSQMLTVADVNGDGIADLIVPNSFGGTTVNVLLGIGDGTFQPPVTYFSGTQPIFVALGDFNGDGILDLAVVNRGDNSISILLGVGDGTFGTAVPITVGSAPTGLVVGDFNADGKLDLAVTNTNDGDVGILIGVGDGTFAAQTTVALPQGSNPYWLATGDLRRNGVLDLVVPDQSNTQAYVLLGNNNGTFATAVPYATGDAGQGLALGDVNGDGILDLVTANTGEDGTVSVLLGLGDGTFSPKTDYSVGNRPLNVVLADFNGDGMLDLADSDGQDGTITILLQAQTQTAIATGVSAPGSSGSQQLTDAAYPGDVGHSSSVSSLIPLSGTMSTATSTTTLSIAPNPVVLGQPTTLTATIAPIPGPCPPPGSVTFYDGSTILGTATVSQSGIATLLISNLPAGSYLLTAEYSGTIGMSGSFSAPVAVHVISATVARVTLALSAPSVVNGTATTMTGAVLNGVTPVTTGMITFCDATATHCEGPAIFGTAVLTSSGTAVLKLTFGVGTYSIDAVFAGDNALQGAVSTTHPLTVTGAGSYASQTTEIASGSSGNYTLTSTVKAFGVAPLSGTVSFLDGSNGNAVVGTAIFNPATRAYGFIPTLDSPLSEPNGPENVVTGDFNNDGILDYAIGDNNVATVSIFIGTGNGAFLPAVTYPVAFASTDLKVADFNGDGKLDLVSVGPTDGPSQVSVLLGVGDGTFLPQVAYAVGAAGISVAVGDFNGDGFQDIAAANIGSSTVSILLGRGDGTFQNDVQYPVGTQPFSLTVGDFNGDGILDLAVLNAVDQTVGVLLGNGDGTFPAQVSYPVGEGSDPFDSDYILAADFNKDGKLDLIVANFDDNTMSIFLGNGDGTFQPQVTYATGSGPNDLAVGDFNHDGNLDVAVSDNEDTTISILYGNGDGTFQAPVIDDVAGEGPWGIAAGDFNGDGLTDLVVTNNDDGTVTVLLNQQSDTAAATGVSVSGDGPHEVAASYPGDPSRSASFSDPVSLNGTNLPATITTVTLAPNPANSGQLVTITATISPAPTGAPLGTVIFYDNGIQFDSATVGVSGIVTYSTTGMPGGENSITAVYSGNATSAGSTSAAIFEHVISTTASTTTLALSSATVTAGTATTLTATVHMGASPVAAGIITFCNASVTPCQGTALLGTAELTANGTAALKLTFGAGTYSIDAIFPGTDSVLGSTSSAQALTVTGASLYATSTAILASGTPGDYTLTGTVTAFGSAALTGSVSFLDTTNASAVVATAAFNPALLSYAFVPTAGSPLAEPNNPENVVTGDFNNDGILDFAVIDSDTSTVSVFIGTGNGSFLPAVTYATANRGNDLKVADFNGDGKLDLVSVGISQGPTPVSVLLGNGDGTFQPGVPYAVGNGAISVAVGDFNGDGFEDVAVANLSGNSVSILLGKGDGTFQTEAEYPVGNAPISLAVGDFNGDGILDLAVVNAADQTVGVLLGNGDGTFPAQVPYPVGEQSEPFDSVYVLVADFNKDGKLDLVVANNADGTVGILLGNGDGTFRPQATYPAGNGPNGLAFGDFNQDGNLDLAVTDNNNTTSVSILYGNGDGTFQSARNNSLVGNGPWGIATGDFNGDGLSDLVVSNNVDGSVTVLLNQQIGTAAATAVAVLGTGTHNVLASYPGDASRIASLSTTVPLQGTITTTTVLTSAPNPVVAAQTVTLTATISPAATGVDVGTVNFYSNGTLLGAGDVVVNSLGVATLTTAALAVGSDNLTAVYSGTAAGFLTSTSAIVTEAVTPVGGTVTATTLLVSPNPATAGQTVTMTATVAPPPTGGSLGSVSFYSGSGVTLTLLGTGTVNVSGIATFATVALPVGADRITAVYSGNATFDTSTSTATTEAVTAIATATTLVAAPVPGIVGHAVTLTATVAPPPTGGTLGTVSFYNGATLLGMGTVNASGVATFTTSSLPLGNASLTAVYSGNATSGTSTSVALMESVVPAGLIATTSTLTFAPNPPVDGQAETFTVTVVPAPTGASLGTVSFYNGATLLGMGTVNSGGVATFTTVTLPFGNLTITAVYSGNATFATSTSSVSMMTEGPGFAVVGPTGPITALQGALITIPLTVPPLGGPFNSVVTMSVTGLPPGAVAVFAPPSVTPGAAGAPTTLAIQLASVALAIPSAELHIPAWPGLALAFGACLLCSVMVLRRTNPRKMRVAFACAGLAVAALLIAGCNGGFSSPPITPAGSYVVTITGTSGVVHSSTTVTVIVK